MNQLRADKPNIVFIIFIMADDLGWMDTDTYGSTFYQTPNITKLAQRGMMFSRAYWILLEPKEKTDKSWMA